MASSNYSGVVEMGINLFLLFDKDVVCKKCGEAVKIFSCACKRYWLVSNNKVTLQCTECNWYESRDVDAFVRNILHERGFAIDATTEQINGVFEKREENSLRKIREKYINEE